MIDPDLQKQFDVINANLVGIKTKTGQGIWRAFFNGMFGALGYMVGLALILLIVGWILNKTGVLPKVQEQAKDFQNVIQGTKQFLNSSPTKSQQGSGQ